MKKIVDAIKSYIKRTDLFLMFIALVAAGIGMVLIYSATRSSGSDRLIVVQGAGVALGFILMLVLSKVDYEVMANLWKFLFVAGVLIMVFTFLFGTGPKDTTNKNWIPLGPVNLQPSELVKILFIVTFGKHLDLVKEHVNSILTFLLLLLHGGIITGLVVITGDMGMALVFIVIMLFMMFIAGLHLRYFAIGTALLVAMAPVAWNYLLEDYQRTRLLMALNPELDPLDQGYQVVQGKKAIGSGGMWGQGFLEGNMTQTGQVPARDTDFIFSVAGEEWGFVGGCIVILVLVMIMARVLMLSRRARDDLGYYICIGVFAMLLCQTFVNLGMVIGIFPVVGITLPFLSYGGSSIVSVFCAMGLVLSVCVHRRTTFYEI